MAINFPEGWTYWPSKIFQVKTSTFTSVHTHTALAWASTGLECAITPLDTSHKILILCNAALRVNNLGNTSYHEAEGQYRITANTGSGDNPMYGGSAGIRLSGYGGQKHFSTNITHNIRDGISNLNQRTYKLQFGGANNTFQIILNNQLHYHATGAEPTESSMITLIEYLP